MADKKLPTAEEIAEIWAMLRQTARNQQETSAQQRKTDAQLAKTDAQLAKTDAQLAKTDAQVKKTSASVKKLTTQLGHDGNRLGRVAESLVANDLKNFMKEHFAVELQYIIRGFNIEDLANGDYSDIDVLGINSDTVVAVEVKTTLDQSHVNRFKNRVLDRFNKINPLVHKVTNIQREKIYGGIAYIKTQVEKNGTIVNEASLIKQAERKGLFVMKIFGKNQTELLNSPGFVPKNYQRR